MTAQTPARLYAIEREPFLTTVTGHPSSAGAAERIVRERLARSARS